MLKTFFLLCTILFITVNAATFKSTNDDIDFNETDVVNNANTIINNAGVNTSYINSIDYNNANVNYTDFQALIKNFKKELSEYKKILNRLWDDMKPIANKKKYETAFLVARNYTEALNNDLNATNASLAKAFKEPKVIECVKHMDLLVNAYECRKTEILKCAESLIEKSQGTLMTLIPKAERVKTKMTDQISYARYCRNRKCKKDIPHWVEYSKSALAKLKADSEAYRAVLRNADPVIDCIEKPIENENFSDNKNDHLESFNTCMSLLTNEIL